MAHYLIIGRTECGKSKGAKVLAKALSEKGKVLVYDILGSTWNGTNIVQVNNEEDFLWYYWSETDFVAVFIDEGGETVKRFAEEMEKTATRGRHNGHQNFYISQRASLLSKTARTQASGVYLFSSTGSDCETLYEDFGNKRNPNDPYKKIFEASQFKPGEFLYFTVEKPPVKMKVDFALDKFVKATLQ